jgi:hypothetical protein
LPVKHKNIKNNDKIAKIKSDKKLNKSVELDKTKTLEKNKNDKKNIINNNLTIEQKN